VTHCSPIGGYCVRSTLLVSFLVTQVSVFSKRVVVRYVEGVASVAAYNYYLPLTLLRTVTLTTLTISAILAISSLHLNRLDL
jgi:hypothetical protein